MRIAALAILACLLWSTSFVCGKIALLYMTPLTLAGARFILAGLMQLPGSGSVGAPFRLMCRQPRLILEVSLSHTVILYACFFIGLQYVRGAQAAILIGTSPLTSVLVAHVMTHDDKFNPRMGLSIVLGIAGVVILSLGSKPWDPVGLREFLGLMLILCGSIASSVGNVIVHRKKGGVHPVAMNSAQMLIGGTVLMSMALLLEGPQELAVPPMFYACLAWLAFVSAAAFSIWFYLLGRVRVSRLNLWKFLIPVFGAGLSWWLLPGESPDVAGLTGMGLVVTGLFLAPRDPEPSRPVRPPLAGSSLPPTSTAPRPDPAPPPG